MFSLIHHKRRVVYNINQIIFQIRMENSVNEVWEGEWHIKDAAKQ